MRMLAAIWGLLDAGQRRRLVLLQLMSVGMALCTVGGIAGIVPFLTALGDPEVIHRYASIERWYRWLHLSSSRDFILALGVLLALATILSSVANLLGFFAINRFAFRIGDSLRIALFERYLRHEYLFHLRMGRSALASNVIHEVTRVTGGVLQSGLVLVAQLATALCLAAAMLLVNPLIALTAMLGLAGGYALAYAAVRERLRRNGASESMAYWQRNQTVYEALDAIRQIILSRSQRYFVERLKSSSGVLSDAAVSTLGIVQIPRYVLECATIVCLVAVGWFWSERGFSAYGFAQLSFAALAMYRLLPALQQVFVALARLRAEAGAFDRVEAELSQSRLPCAPADPALRSSWAGAPRREVRFEHVSFTYMPQAAPALRDITVSIPAGCMVALWGANGAGKTTFVDLLTGLLAPSRGSISVDGIELGERNRELWRAQVAYVPQEIPLCNGSIADNIAWGIEPAQIDAGKLHGVIEAAGLAPCIAAMPRGVDEILGEGYRRLSGGERQRLALARALYLDAPLLVLDEATSALDEPAARELLGRLELLRGTKTIVWVTHEESVASCCDFVLQFANGRLVGDSRLSRALAQG